MHQGDKVHRTVRQHEKTALCDKSVWSSSERAAQRSITAAGRGAGRAASTEGSREAPQRQAPPDMRTGQSAEACLSREVPADHEAQSRTKASCSGNSCRNESARSQSFGGSAHPGGPKQEAVLRQDAARKAAGKHSSNDPQWTTVRDRWKQS